MISDKPKIFFYSLFFSLVAMVFVSHAQKLPSGPQVLTFFSDVDDTEQPYGLYLPENYDPQKKYPLVVMLHGAGSNHRLSLRRVFGKSNLENENDVEASRYFPEWEPVDFIVISPYARGTAGYQGIPEKDVYDALEDAKRRFSVDEDRVYLTGLSMGGGGTLWLGTTRPDIWAAIAPVCPAPPQGTDEFYKNAFNYPVHFFHGDADPVVPVKISRDWVSNLKGIGAKVEYREFPGVKHDSWVKAYEDGYIFDWFSKIKRNPFPEEVKFTTKQYKYNKAYWVEIDALTPGTLATIEAKFTDPNEINITTSGLSALTLNLAGHPDFDKNKTLELKVDGKKFKTKGEGFVKFHKEDDKWAEGAVNLKPTAKQKGQEGPISEAFAGRHVYVYGTLDNPTQEELMQRINLANEAANWSVYRGGFLGRYMVFPRVVSDKELRPSDYENTNLVLFGTKDTNAIIAENQDQLPIHLSDTASNYGLFYIFPLNGNYVAISSGLPWWHHENTPGFNFLPANLSGLSGFKDYILFQNSVENKVGEGYFNNQWSLSEETKAKLEASEVVEVR